MLNIANHPVLPCYLTDQATGYRHFCETHCAMTLLRIAQLNGANVLAVCKQLNCRCVINNLSRKYSLFNLRMASGDRENADKPSFVAPFRRIGGRKLINSNESNQVGQQSTTESDEYFYASECSFQRPSTFEDELLVTRLMKEILADRETILSNWVVENKVKNLCTLYKCLLKPHKEGFLKVLACDHAIDHSLVTKTAKSLTELKQEECEERQVLKVEERLKNLLTPQYSWLFIHMGRSEKGVKFLVDLRTDVLAMVSDLDSTDPLLVPMQQLNATLKEMLSLWFSVGFLTLERVTWRSPCEMLEKISGYEAVHPVRSWTDLKRRVGPYRRCFVFTHSSMPDEPLVVLHTALSDEISQSMRSIVTSVSRMSVDLSTETGLVVDSQVEDPNSVKAAIFYSISSTQKGLQGIELGNYLIKRVVKELQAEFPLVTKFSSLSPVPTFRSWLLEKMKIAEKGEHDILTAEEVKMLQSHLQSDNFWNDLQKRLHNNSWAMDGYLMSILETPLMRLCARYLYLEKRRGFALDSVANFHLRNGSMMWRLNWKADLTPRGLGNSCGIMVNYRYFLEDTETNSRTYLEKQLIAASEQVRQLATGATDLINKVTSKM